MANERVLCNCVICGGPVYARAHQADTVRTCGPTCAKALAVREHPDLKTPESSTGRMGYWRRRLAEEN